MNFKDLCKQLESKIQASYEQGVTVDDAEKLAAEFLYAQLQVSGELKKSDLNSRMWKSGTKALKAAVYLDIVQKSEKRPTEAHMTAQIDSNELITKQQDGLDAAEVARDELERYYNIFLNAHIHYRGVSKGRFE